METSKGEARTTHPDLLLARRAQKADDRAWDEIVARYGERIYNLALRFTGGRNGEAEDLTQDVFLKLYGHLGSYRGEVPLMAWALRLSRNLCVDYYRRHRRRYQGTVGAEVLQFRSGDDDPLRDSWLQQRRELVHQTLAEMGEEQATVVMLRDLQGMAYDEVAHILELPVGTVKSRLNRARRELMSRVTEKLAAAEARDGENSSGPHRAGNGA
ncbi:MAG: sigma-70 family RNA polymerase sigma factor [Acidobacteriota bacterium]